MIIDSRSLAGDTGIVRHTGLEFELSNDVFSFAPKYYPRDVIVTKERNTSEQDALCEGEDVNDMGPKNRVITVNGYLRQNELLAYTRLGDLGDPLDLISLPWTGEVAVKKTEIQGPVAIDNATKDWLYDYTLNLKSTGTDEYGEQNHGILRTVTATDDSIATSDPQV